MIDKIKDFLYDISDVFFSLLIIVVIFLVVTWKISSSMSFDLLPTYFGNSEDTQKELSEVKVIKDTQPSTEDTTTIVDSETTVDTTGKENPDGEDSATDGGSSDTTVKVIEDVKITVEPGSSGHSIATQLLEKNLIPDIKTFNNKVAEMELGGKLQSGSFTLSTGDTLADMIRVLCGKGREDN